MNDLTYSESILLFVFFRTTIAFKDIMNSLLASKRVTTSFRSVTKNGLWFSNG